MSADALARSPIPDCTSTGRYRIIDLGALPAAGTTLSAARGLNEHAVVVGWSGPSIEEPVPFVWIPRDDIYGLDAETIYDLTAFGGAPCFVFGWAEDLNDAGVVAGWRDVEYSSAFDVSEDALGRAVGQSSPCVAQTECQSNHDGVVWTSVGSSPAPTAVEKIFGEVEVWSINDTGLMAGWGRLDDEGENNCGKRALVWDEAADIVTNLHDEAVPPDNELQETIANAINKVDACGRVQVVGANESESIALLWERDDVGDWTRIELLEHIGPCGTYGWTDLLDAADINDKGQICGVGTRNGETRAFLLVCIADLNFDGAVNGTDTGLVSASWGPCPGCPADFNEDDEVDSADVGYALAAWSGQAPCARVDFVDPQDECPSQQQSMMGGDGGAAPVVAALALLGFASIEAFVAWGHEATFTQVQSVLAFVYAMVEEGGDA